MIISGTGHRPSYFPCGYDENNKWSNDIKQSIADNLLKYKASKVLSGMALGFDMWLAEAAIQLQIPVEALLPFHGQEKRWPKQSQERYNNILAQCSNVEYINEAYSNAAFFARDDSLINRADLMLALYDQTVQSGGTYYTYHKALTIGKEVINLWPN